VAVTDRVLEYLNDEINFHNDHKTPWHMRLYCRLTRQKTPAEAIIGTLELLKLQYRICKGEWKLPEEVYKEFEERDW
jgi:hypothetical protein